MADVMIFDHPCGTNTFADTEFVPIGTPESGAPLLDAEAEIHTALFEIPYREAQAILARSLHPSNPAYAGLSFYRVAESPIGAFEWAVLGVACRSAIRPRMQTIASYASTDAAVDFLNRHWGFGAVKAEVHTRFRYDGALSRITGSNGRLIAEVASLQPEMLIGSSRAIRYPQALNPAEVDGTTGLAQVDIAYEYVEAHRGRLSINAFDAAALGGGTITPTDPIAGTFARLKIEMLPVRHIFDLETVAQVRSFEKA